MTTKTRKHRRAEQLRRLIQQTNGRYFGVEFIKRTNNEHRKMCARLGINRTNGKGMKFTPKDYNLMTVWDRNKGDYRMISLDRIISIQIDGQRFLVA